jgi:hypothetical protein
MEIRMLGLVFEAGSRGFSFRTANDRFSVDMYLDDHSVWGADGDHTEGSKFYTASAGRLRGELGLSL